jgi:hypothetical protein
MSGSRYLPWRKYTCLTFIEGLFQMTQARNARGAIVLFVAFLALGCSNSQNRAAPMPAAEVQQLPAGHVPVPQPAETRSSPALVMVAVQETLDAGGYTYSRVQLGGEEAWIAGPRSRIAIGDTLVLSGATPMQNFTSTSLNRTFDVIYFVGAYQKQGAAATDGRKAIEGTEGLVRQTLTGGGYLYVQVEAEGDSLWLAGPMVDVSGGQTVSWRGGAMMHDFTSRTLERTFDRILFVERIAVVR